MEDPFDYSPPERTMLVVEGQRCGQTIADVIANASQSFIVYANHDIKTLVRRYAKEELGDIVGAKHLEHCSEVCCALLGVKVRKRGGEIDGFEDDDMDLLELIKWQRGLKEEMQAASTVFSAINANRARFKPRELQSLKSRIKDTVHAVNDCSGSCPMSDATNAPSEGQNIVTAILCKPWPEAM
ncbi:hypothetical protein Sjap_002175 [Stephania japonica]|uniref:Uncharacterized protein n=1 Tax=Stephania japonica TaxID=461633 RepID=A0AAP0KNZ7_9MAGN